MARDLSKLHPELNKKIELLIKRCKSEGLNIGISETWRTVAEQDALYAKGRTKPGQIVTNARGNTYSSMHQWYVAFDFYRNDGKGAYDNSDGFFQRVGKIGQSLGLEWGGSWTSPVDMPHFQLPDWGSTPSKLKKLYKTPENFISSWKIDEGKPDKNEEMNEEMEKRYKAISELPEWATGTIEKLADEGAIADKNNLDMTEDMVRVLVIMSRVILKDKK
ncbi:peptidoglycan L-alanyl-D-glutamate endopeptidase CwlK [Clostridiales bacterium]|nr:peptidoglycan L-alanyl-D-glutamate endopeptidase CwlK [Clostridiales bacterium]